MSDDILVLLLLGAAAVVVLLALLLRKLRPRRATKVLAVTVGALAALWTLTLLAIYTNFEGAGGFIDCAECTFFQNVVAAVFWWGWAVLVVLGIVEVVSLLVVAARGGMSRERGGGLRR